MNDPIGDAILWYIIVCASIGGLMLIVSIPMAIVAKVRDNHKLMAAARFCGGGSIVMMCPLSSVGGLILLVMGSIMGFFFWLLDVE